MPPIQGNDISYVQYGILDSQTIEQLSVRKITTPVLYRKKKPHPSGLHSTYLGVFQQGATCSTCAEDWLTCPGHFGHLELATRCINVEFSPLILKVLNLFCFHCSKPRYDKEDKKTMADVQIKAINHRLTALLARINTTACDCCGGYAVSFTIQDFFLKPQVPEEHVGPISMEKIFHILRFISDEDARTVGFLPPHSRPENMLWKNFIIPPPIVRPLVHVNDSVTKEDDLTSRLKQIVKLNNQLLAIKATSQIDLLKLNNEHDERHEVYREMQIAVATYQNSKKKPKNHKVEYGSDRKCIRFRFSGKTSKRGRVRQTVFGKRQNYSARSVVIGDPSLAVNEVGVPRQILKILTFPERAFALNLRFLQGCVDRGPHGVDGANYVVRGGRRFDLKFRSNFVVRAGDIVERHLRKGDDVIFNRQPSLHRMSLMAHKVHPVDGKALRIHIATTPAYNADFDGDEMNLHTLLSVQTRAEGQEILNVQENLIKDGRPIIKIVQHAALAVYKMTTRGIQLNKREFCQYAYICQVTDIAEKTVFTELDILSLTLPPKVFIQTETLHINNSIVTLAKGVTRKVLNNVLVYTIWKDCGSQKTIQFIKRLYDVTHYYLEQHGISITIDDCYLKQDKSDLIQRTREYVASKFHNHEPSGNVENEMSLCSLYESLRHRIGERTVQGMGTSNNLKLIIDSGAKGNTSNLVQISGMIGQQMDHKSQRIQAGTSHDNTDLGENYGMIYNSFSSGMNPRECFNHLIGSRVGLVDTAVKTSETGYCQRRIVKAMEDVIVDHMGVVTHVDGRVIQFLYGGDGYDPCFLERIAIFRINDSKKIWPTWRDHDVRMDENALERHQHQRKMLTDAMRESSKKLQGMFTKLKGDEAFISSILSPFNYSKKISFLPELRHTDITPFEVLLVLREVEQTLRQRNHLQSVCQYFAFIQLMDVNIIWGRVNMQSLLTFGQHILAAFEKAKIAPHSAVGVIAGQHCSEPFTQMTLNRFHVSGQFSELVNGVHRMKEIMNVSKKPKQPFMTIYTQDDGKTTLHELGSNLVGVVLKDIVLYHYSVDTCPVAIPDEYAMHFRGVSQSDIITLAIRLDRGKMIRAGLSPRMIAYQISLLCNVVDTFWYSPLQDLKWFLYIRTHSEHPFFQYAAQVCEERVNSCSVDSVLVLLYEKMLAPMLLQGIRGVMDFYVESNKIVTKGSSFQDVLKLPWVDSKQTTTSHIWEIFHTLGIDAANAALKHEWATVMQVNGASVSYRHISLIVDVMTHDGTLRPMTYQGICSRNVSVIKNASFEKPIGAFLQGAARGIRDGILDTMSSVCWNKLFGYGTGGVELYDEGTAVPRQLEQFRSTTSPSRKRTRASSASNPASSSFTTSYAAMKKVRLFSCPQFVQSTSSFFRPWTCRPVLNNHMDTDTHMAEAPDDEALRG